MKVHVIIILTLIKLGASEVDEELQEKFKTLSRSNFVEYFNKQNYTWKIKEYSNITINLNNTNVHQANRINLELLPVRRYRYSNHTVNNLQPNFDSRLKWPECRSIREIYNQFGCGSCWANSVANVASDRTCIHTGKPVRLSEQDLECAHPNHTICYGGYTQKALIFWKNAGLVTQNCKPYEPWSLNRRACLTSCVPGRIPSYELNKHYAREIYGIPIDDGQIRAEIFFRGPITATFRVYQDLQSLIGDLGYQSGIYEHKFGDHVTDHAVRVIGYGEEKGIPYWLVANSWSSNWGENGFFRVKRFDNGVDFENLMFTGMPEIKAW